MKEIEKDLLTNFNVPEAYVTDEHNASALRKITDKEFNKLVEECKPFMKEEIYTPNVITEATDTVEIKCDGFSPIFNLFTIDRPPINVVVKVGNFTLLLPRCKFKTYPRVKQLKRFYKSINKKGINLLQYTYGSGQQFHEE